MTAGSSGGHDSVVFDLDGVVLDSRAAFARCINVALAENGLQPRESDELARFLGPSLHEAFLELTGSARLAGKCVDSYRALYRATAAESTPVFPGMRELLDDLRGELPLAVATAKAQAIAVPLLDALELTSFFTAVIGPELNSLREPKAVTVRRALACLPEGATPVMVGDREHDVVAAHENGLSAVGVLWGIGSEGELRAAGADTLAETPTELARMLRVPTARQPE